MPNVRPIDANALVEALEAVKKDYEEANNVLEAKVATCSIKFLTNERVAPTLDYAPVRHGEWTAIDAPYWRWMHDGAHPVRRIKYRHDECGKIVITKEPYCPNCGAKMDGGKDDEQMATTGL